MKTIVIDTNVLLADPGILLSFPDVELAIPETVLGELDKLKTSRVDPDLRFRGREVSRTLFELSEQGGLISGVELPDGGSVRVVPLDGNQKLPEGLSTRNTDDRILAVAYQMAHTAKPGTVSMLTNDLNMLLKAQTYGIEVERHSEGPDGGFAKRYIIRPFQRYRVPLSILATSLAVFAAIIVLTIWGPGSRTGIQSAVPTEFREQLPADQQRILDYLTALEQNDADLDARLSLANLYYELRLGTGDIRYSTLATRHYERYLEIRPDTTDVRANLAGSYFYGGQTDRAIQEALRILEQEPDHLQANFNLGVFYWRGRQEYAAAATQFSKVVELTQNGDERTLAINRDAAAALQQVREDAVAAGQPLPEGGTF